MSFFVLYDYWAYLINSSHLRLFEPIILLVRSFYKILIFIHRSATANMASTKNMCMLTVCRTYLLLIPGSCINFENLHIYEICPLHFVLFPFSNSQELLEQTEYCQKVKLKNFWIC